MGIINHNTVIATTGNKERAVDLRKWFDCITDDDRKLIKESESWVNGYITFFVAPDGSKEGWEESNTGNALRERFIARLAEDNYTDGSSPWDWVEISFGEYGQKIIRGNCKKLY